MNRTVDMTTSSPTKHILRFSLPLIITNLGQQLYTIADAAIVGRGVGVQALAAVGSSDWCYWLILWSVTGLTQAFSTFVSRHFGNKDYRSMNRSIAMSVFLCAVIGSILTAGGLLAAKPLLVLLNTPDDIIRGTTTYLMTMIAGTLIVMAYNMASSILRALGDGKTPLLAMVIAALLNIGLDCLFILVFHWGILGAALASVLAQLFSFLYCLRVLKKIACIRLDKDAWKLERSMLREMLLFGLPVTLQFIIICIGGIILQSSINLQGSAFIAGYTATNKVYGLLESGALSLGLACSTFLAQNYGAGFYGRVKQGVVAATKIVVVMAVAVVSVTMIFRKYFLRLFLDISQPGGAEALEIGVHYLTIMASCLIILFLLHVFRNTLQAMQIAKWSMVSGVLEFIARVFMSKVAIQWIGTDALFISEPAAWLGALLSVMLPYFYYRKHLLKE